MYIDIVTTIKRTSIFWDDKIDDEKVGAYLKILTQKYKKIEELKNELPYNMRDNVEKMLESLLSKIDSEIKVCKFYFEYNQKKRKLDYFKQWKLFKKEERQDLKYDWQKENSGYSDAWVMTNGRILSAIEIKDNISSIRVSLNIQNDSSVFNFTNRNKEVCYKNFRKKESATEYAEKLKIYASEILKEELLPSEEEYHNTKILLKLLHINQTIFEE